MAKSRENGMLYMLWVAITISILLFINRWLVDQFIYLNSDWLPEFSNKEDQEKAEQVVSFVVPVALIFVEFWFFDWLQDMTTSPPKRAKKAKS